MLPIWRSYVEQLITEGYDDRDVRCLPLVVRMLTYTRQPSSTLAIRDQLLESEFTDRTLQQIWEGVAAELADMLCNVDYEINRNRCMQIHDSIYDYRIRSREIYPGDAESMGFPYQPLTLIPGCEEFWANLEVLLHRYLASVKATRNELERGPSDVAAEEYEIERVERYRQVAELARIIFGAFDHTENRFRLRLVDDEVHSIAELFQVYLTNFRLFS